MDAGAADAAAPVDAAAPIGLDIVHSVASVTVYVDTGATVSCAATRWPRPGDCATREDVDCAFPTCIERVALSIDGVVTGARGGASSSVYFELPRRPAYEHAEVIVEGCGAEPLRVPLTQRPPPALALAAAEIVDDATARLWWTAPPGLPYVLTSNGGPFGGEACLRMPTSPTLVTAPYMGRLLPWLSVSAVAGPRRAPSAFGEVRLWRIVPEGTRLRVPSASPGPDPMLELERTGASMLVLIDGVPADDAHVELEGHLVLGAGGPLLDVSGRLYALGHEVGYLSLAQSPTVDRLDVWLSGAGGLQGEIAHVPLANPVDYYPVGDGVVAIGIGPLDLVDEGGAAHTLHLQLSWDVGFVVAPSP